MKKKKIYRKLISIILCLGMIFSTWNIEDYSVVNAEQADTVAMPEEVINQSEEEDIFEYIEDTEEEVDDITSETEELTTEAIEELTTEELEENLADDELLQIGNKIGTVTIKDILVCTDGSGETRDITLWHLRPWYYHYIFPGAHYKFSEVNEYGLKSSSPTIEGIYDGSGKLDVVFKYPLSREQYEDVIKSLSGGGYNGGGGGGLSGIFRYYNITMKNYNGTPLDGYAKKKIMNIYPDILEDTFVDGVCNIGHECDDADCLFYADNHSGVYGYKSYGELEKNYGNYVGWMCEGYSTDESENSPVYIYDKDHQMIASIRLKETVQGKSGAIERIKLTTSDFDIKYCQSSYKIDVSADTDISSDRIDVQITKQLVSESEKEKEGIKLVSALYRHGSVSKNVLTAKHTIVSSQSDFDLECKVKDPTYVKKYIIYSGSTKIAESTTGKFVGLRARDFYIGKDIKIKVEGKTQNQTSMLFLTKKQGKTISSLSIGGDGISGSLDEELSFFSGSSFKISLPNVIPVNVVEEDGLIKIGINIKEKELYNSTAKPGEKNKSTSAKMKSMMDDIKKTGQIATNYKQYLQTTDFKSDFPGMQGKVKFNIVGYLQISDSDCLETESGEVVVTVSGSIKNQKQFLVGHVPITVSFTSAATGKMKATVKYDFKKAKWSGLSGDCVFSPSVTFELYPGVGFGTILSGGVYGNAEIGLDWILLSSSQKSGVDNSYIYGEAGLCEYFAGNEFKQPLISIKNLRKNDKYRKYIDSKNHLVLYSRDNPSYLKDHMGKDINISDFYEKNSNEDKIQWVEKEEAKVFSKAVDDIVIGNVSVGAEPQVVDLGDKSLVVYMDYDNARNVYNQAVVKYVLYDNQTQKFGEAQVVNDDGTPDNGPRLYSFGNEYYLVYQNAVESFSDNFDGDINLFAKKFGITIERYDVENNEFEIIDTIYSDNYCYNPVLCETTEGLNLFFVSNSDNDLQGLTNKNEVNSVVISGDKVTKKEILYANKNSIESISYDPIDNILVYIEDGDNIVETPDKVTTLANLKTGEENTIRGIFSGLQYNYLSELDTNKITIINEGKLSYLENNTFINLVDNYDMSSCSEYKIIGSDVYCLDVNSANDEIERNICKITREGTENIISQVTHEKYVDGFSFLGNKILYVSTMAEFDDEGELNTTSSIKLREEIYDVSATVCNVISDEYNVIPNENNNISISYKNTGSTTIETMEITIENDIDHSKQKFEISSLINPEEVSCMDVQLYLPGELDNAMYSVYVSSINGVPYVSSEEEIFKLDYSKTELQLQASYNIEENILHTLNVDVTNLSNVPADYLYEIRNEQGDVLSECYGYVEGNETCSDEIDIEDIVNESDVQELVCVITSVYRWDGEEQVALNEYYDDNNVAYVKLYPEVAMEDERFIINYELNGGINNTSNPTEYIRGKEITLQNPSKKGYSFAGWYREATFNNPISKISATEVGEITIYAKWTANTYTVKFDGNGATSGSMSALTGKKYGSEFSLPANAFKKKGYTFKGWATASSGDVKYTNKETVKNLTATNKGTVTLYAKWAKTKYSISYELNGGTNSVDNPDSYTISTATITLAKPTKKGYTFGGWYLDDKFSSDKKITEIAKGSTGNKTLYAKWTKNKYAIEYVLNGGTNSADNPASYTITTPTITLAKPTRKGYKFSGWFSDEKFTTKVTEIAKGSTGKKTLYAKWAKQTYTITYELNGGTNAEANPATYNISTATITLANPTKKGYTFGGWYSDSAFTKQVTQIAKGSTGNKTLYAKWTKNTYTIKFDGNGATSGSMANVACKYATTVELPANAFKRTGYTFKGWATTATGEVKYANKESVKNLTATNKKVVTLYAIWGKTKYKISYNLDGGTNNAENPTGFYYTTATITLKNPTKTGYTFGGWYSDAAFKTRVKEIPKGTLKSVTLYAKWTANSYSITFDANVPEGEIVTGSMDAITGCKYTQTVTLPSSAFASEGYTFVNWNTAADGSGTAYAAGESVSGLSGKKNGTVTLYAQWSEIGSE